MHAASCKGAALRGHFIDMKVVKYIPENKVDHHIHLPVPTAERIFTTAPCHKMPRAASHDYAKQKHLTHQL